MPWNEADRETYEVIRDRYSTDMSDTEFELISPLLPAPKKRWRKPTEPHWVCRRQYRLSPAAMAGFSSMVKVFGCREAYENRPSTNPRACGSGLWGF